MGPSRKTVWASHLSETFRLGVLLKAEGREMHARAEHARLGQDADTANTVNLHLHVWVAIWITKVGQVRTPCGILGVALHNDGIFVESICQGQGRLGLLPRVKIVGLLATEPVRQRTPDVCGQSAT